MAIHAAILAMSPAEPRRLPDAHTAQTNEHRGARHARPQVTWLTQESYDRLKAELDQLDRQPPGDRRGDQRPSRRGATCARTAGYHAAREEQGQQEAWIRQPQELLNNAKVGEAPLQSGWRRPETVVKACTTTATRATPRRS